MNKTEKIQLPDAGQSIIVKLSPNAFGATSLKISNWKGVRFYIDWSYKTQYNQKSAKIGWIAVDGSDWNLSGGNSDVEEVIKKIKAQVIK